VRAMKRAHRIDLAIGFVLAAVIVAIVVATYVGYHFTIAVGSGSTSAKNTGSNDSTPSTDRSPADIRVVSVNWTTIGCAATSWVGPGFNASNGSTVNLTQFYHTPPPPPGGPGCNLTSVASGTSGFEIEHDNLPVSVGLQDGSTLRVAVSVPDHSYSGTISLSVSSAWSN
jgi:hypothetical protein